MSERSPQQCRATENLDPRHVTDLICPSSTPCPWWTFSSLLVTTLLELLPAGLGRELMSILTGHAATEGARLSAEEPPNLMRSTFNVQTETPALKPGNVIAGQFNTCSMESIHILGVGRDRDKPVHVDNTIS